MTGPSKNEHDQTLKPDRANPHANDATTRSEAEIDEAIEESMGASEPPAYSVPVHPFKDKPGTKK